MSLDEVGLLIRKSRTKEDHARFLHLNPIVAAHELIISFFLNDDISHDLQQLDLVAEFESLAGRESAPIAGENGL